KSADAIRIRHMIEAGERALRIVSGRMPTDLDSDETLRLALARAVEVLGEAASRVSPETRSATPSVPWTDAIAMRNRLVHVYFDVDHAILRKTAVEDIPDLLPLLRALLRED
ncbi:MAG: HepT-like ribonuclease domain-containing protein, partial [Acetobacteraceae bacterium]